MGAGSVGACRCQFAAAGPLASNLSRPRPRDERLPTLRAGPSWPLITFIISPAAWAGHPRDGKVAAPPRQIKYLNVNVSRTPLPPSCLIWKTGHNVHEEAARGIAINDSWQAVYLERPRLTSVESEGVRLVRRCLPATLILEAAEEVDEAVHIEQSIDKIRPHLWCT